jgi:dolichol-phosphate mannosyltransferase
VSEISIIIPTYNESKNIEKIVRKLNQLGLDIEIIVVDDDSPDGTGKIAEQLKENYTNIKVLRRKERGLASAVVKGFGVAESELIGVMDADLSHPPEVIPNLLMYFKNKTTEVVVGSRYIKGGDIIGWNRFRKITSKGAILLARPLTPVKDSVSGFFFFKKELLTGVNLNPKGYKIGLEFLVKTRAKKIVEVPYVFVNRRCGKSKLSLRVYIDYLFHLIALYRFKLKGI